MDTHQDHHCWFFLFISNLTDEIEALPPFSRPHILSVSLPKDMPPPPEFISQPLSPRSLAIIDPPSKPICPSLGGDTTLNPPPVVTIPLASDIP